MNQPAHVAQVLADYALRESGQTETWTPLRSEFELAFRLAAFYAMRQALILLDSGAQKPNILDVGCGMGRSTRMYLDLGCEVEQLTGLDMRSGAIAVARRRHPTIRYVLHDGYGPLVDGVAPDLVSMIAVMSSIKGHAGRACLADRVLEAVKPGGEIFYFDLFRANDYAGRDRLRPVRLFSSCTSIWHRYFWSYEFIPRRERLRALVDRTRSTYPQHTLRSHLIRHILPSFEALCVRKP
jgi:SAM-dependent methyltransferase